MKKVLSFLLVLAFLVAGSAMAQGNSHDVSVKIPNLLRLRIVDGSTAAATAPAVSFDYNSTTALIDAYIAEVNGDTSAGLAPTTVTDFGNAIVFSNRTSWQVTVSATALSFTDDVVAGLTAAGVALSDISIVPGAVSGLTAGTGVTLTAGWNLSTTTPIATGGKTTGWSSLGFDGSDYLLTVDGDENPGTYDSTVTYSIVGL